MKKILLLFLCAVFASCSNYYLCIVDNPTTLYKQKDTATTILIIEPGKQIITARSYKNFEQTQFGSYEGYILKTRFRVENKYSSKDIKYLTFHNDSIYIYSNPSNTAKTLKSSSSSSNSSSSSSGGTVYVKGYYRKDGTYVRPHTRSAPKRKG